jgi:hypothetical protein
MRITFVQKNSRVIKEIIMNPLLKLADHGQSVWLDFITRRFITEGKLQRLINEDGLSGGPSRG